MRVTRLRGARTHNLTGLDLDLEPGTLVVVAGPSGAGKSSLAFGTLYAEGQRRYVESFSAYARQFLERLARPPVTELDPVPAGIAVDRQAPVRTSRSTVGTMTEIADYAKSLWARAAELECPGCGRPVVRDEPEPSANRILEEARDQKLVVTYPVHVTCAEHFLGVREALLADGYRRLWLNGEARDLDTVPPSELFGTTTRKKRAPARSTKKRKQAPAAAARDAIHLDVLADRTTARPRDLSRLTEAIEQALRKGAGRCDVVAEHAAFKLSSALHCAHCDRSFRDPTPGTFSFNSPIGACETCRGFGRVIAIDYDRVIPDRSLALGQGAIRAWRGKSTSWERKELAKHAAKVGVPMDVPIEKLSETQLAWLLEGDGVGWPKGWWGIEGWFDWLQERAYKMHVRVLLSRYRKYEDCGACGGSRLKPEASWWRVDGASLPELYRMPVAESLAFLRRTEPRLASDPATALLLRECASRMEMLVDVGLGYLTLDRQSRTLSGGEAQRVALTGALGASLTGAMFVLDEPTVGLHPRDVDRLYRVVRELTHGDNLAIVVEHDPDVIRGADRVIELGPGAGEHGGRVVFDGTPAALAKAKTATGRALRARSTAPRTPREPKGWLRLSGATGHNLRDVTVEVPIGVLTCVTGVSGSGKSSLVLETLYPAVARRFGRRGAEVLPHAGLDGDGPLRGVVKVDQAPLGRTSRGNPATYLKAWDVIRKRFVVEPLAKQRGYTPGTFSFNVAGGRCEACKGEGAETVEMQFLADVTFSCPECQGKRFVGAVLDVTCRGKSVADLLEMTATEVLALFENEVPTKGGPRTRKPDRELVQRLGPLVDVGLGYLRLGQPLNTLSGGEAQRLKLAEALAGATPGSLVVLDEPTAGLHADDVTPLLSVLDALVARGDTVVVVEHDMRLAAFSDWVIDLGPGAGDEGGRIVAAGTPAELARSKESITAPFLAEELGLSKKKRAPAKRKANGASNGKKNGASHALAAISVTNAREHNLKGVSIEIPREKLVVVTGPSGSGKSTLAFDVIFAEGQRRYLETLSPYARQYMPQLPRPVVDRVAGVPPSVSLEQRTTRGGVNSTVATITEVAHYLRLLWARAGLLHCPDCGDPIAPRQPAALASDLRERFGARAELTVMASIVRGRKGSHRELLMRARKEGFTEARIDGELEKLVPNMLLSRFKEHDVDLVVGRVRANDPSVEELLRRAMQRAEGSARVLCGDTDLLVSSKRACPSCGTGFPELDPRFFSFNTRQGACFDCDGHGVVVATVGRGKNAREVERTCASCSGTRLSPLARAVTVDGRSITELLALSVSRARDAIPKVTLHGRDREVGEAPLSEAARRLAFLDQVGLGYLGLDRSAHTLSGGEMQRVRLAAQLGSGLTGVLYVLDEPTIGLHPRDTGRLLGALRELVDRGNSVLVVEHDADTIRAADELVDVGPGGGRNGGRIVAQGAPARLLRDPSSITGAALARPPLVPAKRRKTSSAEWLELRGAREHNLKDVTVRVPLGRFVAVTGVSGSGKSTLVRDVLLRATRQALGLVTDAPGAFESIAGTDPIERAIEIDQSPIGRTPRSVPATYIGVWDELRRMLAGIPEARARGYTASRFSFNVKGGRCDECEGQGALSVEMSFLPQVLVPCESCHGARFNQETRSVELHGLDAGRILGLDVADAAELFAAVPKVARPLSLLTDLGLGYLKLGQASNTLSGGEAQRLKLVSELGTSASGRTLYVMDEPTTGLHRDDVHRLLGVLDRLVERGDTVVVIEHHPDVILAADHVIDLGPEGGEGGGRIVATGTPEEIAGARGSHTGAVLSRELALVVAPSKTRARPVYVPA